MTSGPFAIVPAFVATDRRMSASAFRVLVVMASYADRQGRCWPSLRTLADELGHSPSTVCEHIAKLVELGAVVRDHVGRNQHERTVYRLAWRLLDDDPISTGARPGRAPRRTAVRPGRAANESWRAAGPNLARGPAAQLFGRAARNRETMNREKKVINLADALAQGSPHAYPCACDDCVAFIEARSAHPSAARVT